MQWEKGRVMEKSEEEFWMREREREGWSEIWNDVI